MTLSEQFDVQLGWARTLLRETSVRELLLVCVTGAGYLPRISIVGHALTPRAIEIWRARGANVHIIYVVTRED